MLMLFGRGVNVFEQIEELLLAKPEYYVIKPVVEELEKILRKGGVKEKKAARLALEAVKKYCRVIDIERPPGVKVDDLIVRVAVENKFIVATNDRELRRKLREKGVPEIYFREEKRLLESQGVF
ncbi:30S processome protein Utp24 [Desulfurococcaceae archaeon MEX13E-LK6-19]|nr:30S processome protein Utp24 [Desulfurococcaceae archaeon MEX13E-LK6-19]